MLGIGRTMVLEPGLHACSLMVRSTQTCVSLRLLTTERSWLNGLKKAGHPKLKAEPLRTMATRFCDLERIPYGEKCYYIRQGDIEHLMYFTGARLLNKTLDCPLREAYPCLIWMRRYQKKRCVVCKKLLASWVVLDSSRCPFNPAHFCRICFKHFSQDERGEYIPPLDYKVFPYLHEESEAS